MNNKGFEIKLNGKVLCIAGQKENHGVVTCIINAIFRKKDETQQLNLNVSGLNSDTLEYTKWIKETELKLDDEILIKVVDTHFDLPKETKKHHRKELSIDQKLKKYYKLKEELKEHL